jgi:hypothetical protein
MRDDLGSRTGHDAAAHEWAHRPDRARDVDPDQPEDGVRTVYDMPADELRARLIELQRRAS